MSIMSILKRARIEYGPYIRWKRDLITELTANSRMVDTERGPIEYKIYGTSGPYVSFMHGGPGGYDQAEALFPGVFEKGFRILSWSRPGYLNTPLNVGRTFEDQADAFASLLNTLGIDRTAVIAYSAGSLPAFHFAACCPHKIWALILEGAVSQKYRINKYNVGELIFFSRLMFRSPYLWLADIIGRHAPLLVGWAAIEMESSLDEDEVVKLMIDIMKDEQRVKILMDLIRSMSPAKLRKKGLRNDLKQLAMITSLPLEYVNAPTLVIHGANDVDVPLDHGQRAARLIPNAEIHIVEKGFHVLALSDAAAEINTRRIMFLKTHAPQ